MGNAGVVRIADGIGQDSVIVERLNMSLDGRQKPLSAVAGCAQQRLRELLLEPLQRDEARTSFGFAEDKIQADERFSAIDRAIGKEGSAVVFLLRLSPIFPYGLLSRQVTWLSSNTHNVICERYLVACN